MYQNDPVAEALDTPHRESGVRSSSSAPQSSSSRPPGSTRAEHRAPFQSHAAPTRARLSANRKPNATQAAAWSSRAANRIMSVSIRDLQSQVASCSHPCACQNAKSPCSQPNTIDDAPPGGHNTCTDGAHPPPPPPPLRACATGPCTLCGGGACAKAAPNGVLEAACATGMPASALWWGRVAPL